MPQEEDNIIKLLLMYKKKRKDGDLYLLVCMPAACMEKCLLDICQFFLSSATMYVYAINQSFLKTIGIFTICVYSSCSGALL